MVLVRHVMQQDQVIKGSCDIMGRSTSRQVTILQTFIA